MDEIKGFEKILKEILELKKKKSEDYGMTWRAFGLDGIWPMIGKKFARIWMNKNKPKEKLNFESMEDTLIDMVVYCVMALQLIKEKDTEDKISKLLNN